MKLLKNRILYDSSQGQVIVRVKTETEELTLCRGKYGGNYFQLKKESNLPLKIVPMKDQEAFEFCQANKASFKTPREFELYMNNYFSKLLPKRKRELKIPPKAQLIAEADGEQLYYDADQFFISNANGVKVIFKVAALDWLEDHQGQLNCSIDDVLDKYLITTYRRP